MDTQRALRKAPYILVAASVCAAVTLAALLAMGPGAADASTSGQDGTQPPEWHKGATIRSSSPEAFGGAAFQRSLEEWADLGGNYVTLVIPSIQDNVNSTEVRSDPSTPSRQALIDGIQSAHELGLAVNLLPHIDTADYTWRARIQPADLDAWFASYGEMLTYYAGIGEEQGAEMVTIGTELASITGQANTSQWRDLINDVRDIYSGELTYSANWGGDPWSREADNIEFWDDLDYIGIAAYFPFDPPYTVNSLREQWDQWERSRIRPLNEEWDMPVLFTEIGYRSVQGALAMPWDWELAGAQDQEAQAAGYEALLEYWSEIDYFNGLHIWNWQTASDPSFWESEAWSLGYTPQRKPAEDVLEEQFEDIEANLGLVVPARLPLR